MTTNSCDHMGTTKLRTYVRGNNTSYVAELVEQQELTIDGYTMQEHQDIEEGFATAFDIDEFVNGELDNESFCDEHTDNVPIDWMLDVLNDKYNLVTVNETALFNNILDLLAIHGFENASITVNGTTYN